MKHTQKSLMLTTIVAAGISLVMVVLFELDILPSGLLAGNGGSDEFVAATIMSCSHYAQFRWH